MLPKGFAACGIHCGIAKKKEKKDIAVFYSRKPAIASAMFTSNLVKAAPVKVSSQNVSRSSFFRAIIANSGCANACTGARGIINAKNMCKLTAESFDAKPVEILVASTGVIGRYLPMYKIRNGIKILSSKVLNGTCTERSAVEAIMTTDTVEKIFSRNIKIGKNRVTIWGCAKGAGMIHPDLKLPHATMLSFILTDAVIDKKALRKSLNLAVEQSFNCVSVDGDTSTNDTVFVLANGASGSAAIKSSGKYYEMFAKALGEVCLELAKMIARDGEGATKLVEIEIKNAKDYLSAKKIASTVATSPLVKTAIFGRDANWGRILAACGRSGVKMNPDKVDIFLGDIMVAKRGIAVNFSEAKALKILGRQELRITVDLHQGNVFAKYYTCDFSFGYIKTNANYRT